MFLRWALSAVAGLAFAASASAQNYSQAIALGDRVDSGAFLPGSKF